MTRSGRADSAWKPDLLEDFQQQTLALGADPDGEGDLVTTMVRSVRDGHTGIARHAVLVVHGYTDYFFNTELADFFTGRGFAFYAIDLHKCGRSHRPGQTPHFTTDLARYDVELDLAVELIAADVPGAQILVCGHSAGGLIAALWLDRRRRRGTTALTGVTGLVLNSPFFDLHGPAMVRSVVATAAIGAMSRVRKTRRVRPPRQGGYGQSLHRDYGGDFDYDLTLKPLGGFPVTFGWIHAIRRGHAQLHRGLDVGVPNLILRSDRSIPETTDPDAMQRGDAVLDVDQIARWAGCVGNRTAVVPIVDAKHDVFLSLPAPRQAAYRELGAWLDWHASFVQSASRDRGVVS